MKKIFFYFIRSVLFCAVFLTVCDPLARIFQSPVLLRRILLSGNFTVDLIFSIEFFILLYSAVREKRTGSYVLSRAFWTDLLSSVPLLLFHSGLMMLSDPAGKSPAAGPAPMAWLAVPFSSFQYFRLLKWMERTRPRADALSRSRTGRMVCYGIWITAVFLLLGSFFQAAQAHRLKQERTDRYRQALAGLENINLSMNIPLRPLIFKLFSADPAVLKMTYNEFLILSRMDPDHRDAFYERTDYSLLLKGEYRLMIMTADLDRPYFLYALFSSLLLLFLVWSALFIFAEHLDRFVTKPVRAVTEGLAARDAVLVIRADAAMEKEPDEIARLIREYNERYLPLKQRMEERRKQKTILRLDDLLRFRKPR